MKGATFGLGLGPAVNKLFMPRMYHDQLVITAYSSQSVFKRELPSILTDVGQYYRAVAIL